MSPDHAKVEAIKQADPLTPEYRPIKCRPILDRGVHKLHPEVDACPIGLGAMLTQSGKVISFASKALSSVERCSSQIEREALAVSWGYHHFRMYLLGSHFKEKTGPQVPVAHLQQAYFSSFSKN